MGLGTTMKAAMIANRNSIGYDIDENLGTIISEDVDSIKIDSINGYIKGRFDRHLEFVKDREENQKKEVKHINDILDCKVMTKQEKELRFEYVNSIVKLSDKPLKYIVDYDDNASLKDLPFIDKGGLF
jgi:site-specific DNA-methyltransferase (adenine-specific)